MVMGESRARYGFGVWTRGQACGICQLQLGTSHPVHPWPLSMPVIAAERMNPHRAVSSISSQSWQTVLDVPIACQVRCTRSVLGTDHAFCRLVGIHPHISPALGGSLFLCFDTLKSWVGRLAGCSQQLAPHYRLSLVCATHESHMWHLNLSIVCYHRAINVLSMSPTRERERVATAWCMRCHSCYSISAPHKHVQHTKLVRNVTFR